MTSTAANERKPTERFRSADSGILMTPESEEAPSNLTKRSDRNDRTEPESECLSEASSSSTLTRRHSVSGFITVHLPYEQHSKLPVREHTTAREAFKKLLEKRDIPRAMCVVRCGPDATSPKIDLSMELAQLAAAHDEVWVHMPNLGAGIHHRFVAKTFLSLTSCDVCHKQIWLNGYKCERCLVLFHAKCWARVPQSCQPNIPTLQLDPEFIFRLRALSNESVVRCTAGVNGSTAHHTAQHTARNSIPASAADSHVQRRQPATSLGSAHTLDPIIEQSAEASDRPVSLPPGADSLAEPFSAPPQRKLSRQTQISEQPLRSRSSTEIQPPKVRSHESSRESLTSAVVEKSSTTAAALGGTRRKMLQRQKRIVNGDGDRKQQPPIGSSSAKLTTADSGVMSMGTIEDEENTPSHSFQAVYTAKNMAKHLRKAMERQRSLDDWEIPPTDIKIGEKVGSGSFGTVYKSDWFGEVAVKQLNCGNPTQVQLLAFKKEATLLKTLRHTNILMFMGWMRRPRLSIVTAWCAGESLFKHLHVRDPATPFSMHDLIDIAKQTSQAMRYLHFKNVIHRDLKSNNIFLTEDWTVKIGDFGLATVKTRWAGNRQAPEIIRSRQSNAHNAASDVYAFGVVLYELLTNQLPYQHVNSVDQIMFTVGRGYMRPKVEQAQREDTPFRLTQLCQQCYHFQPENRPSFAVIVELLVRLHNTLPRIKRSVSDPTLNEKQQREQESSVSEQRASFMMNSMTMGGTPCCPPPSSRNRHDELKQHMTIAI